MKVLFWTLLTSLLFSRAFALNGRELQFSRGVNNKHQEILLQDLERLDRLNLDAREMLEWLEERVHYIVDQKTFKTSRWYLGKQLFVVGTDINYPFNQKAALSGTELLSQIEEENENAVTVMSNVGAAVYIQGKNERKLYQMKIPTALFKTENVLVDSPRAGVIQIGPGLFESRFNINNANPDSVANSIHRLSVLFHEARHSDGHAESLGFVHVRCPKGHDYEGLYACDAYQNGAYAISAQVTEKMLNACNDQCSTREEEILKLVILDAKNRIMGKTFGNPSPEKLK